MTRRTIYQCGMTIALASAPWAQLTRCVSVDSGGTQGNGASFSALISYDGRTVAFWSQADNLVPGDTNGKDDIFVHDRQTGRTRRVSVGTNGEQGNRECYRPSMSFDGRYVAFDSDAWTLVPGDTNRSYDVFVHDCASATTTRVSVGADGMQSNGGSAIASISPDGRFVAFESVATNLVSPDRNGNMPDILLHDRWTGSTKRVNVASTGAQADDWSNYPCLSFDGRIVAFTSAATNLVPDDTNGLSDVFVRDLESAETTRISVATGGGQSNGQSLAPSLSSDGRYVAFWSSSSDLVPDDTNGDLDGFVHNRQTGTTERVTVGWDGAQANRLSNPPRISADGRYVAFHSWASNLVPMDLNGWTDVFLRDLWAGTTTLVTVAIGGGSSDWHSSPFASPSADGRFVAFSSDASNLVPADGNANHDVFVRDHRPSGFTSSCDSGAGGVIDCPCANPPGGLGRGCDNASATGGAVLSASGIAYVASDELVFTTSGENPAATSLLLQGSGSVEGGAVFGRGVSCVGGTIIRRLFTKSAVGGSITVPDFGTGDPTVSERSAEKGDVIQAGESRWYLVYYRDTAVTGGCPSASTFNASQTGRIDWEL